MARAVRLMRWPLALLLLWAALDAAAVSVVDGWGREVELPNSPQRVVTLAPHLAETVFALGLGSKLVATVAFTDHPEQARSVARVGDAFALSWEALTAARPDVILAWGGALTRERLQRLQTLGAAVYVSEPRSLDDVLAELTALGTGLGGDVAVVEDFERRLRNLAAGGTKRRVLPLIEVTPPMTVSRGHFVDDLLVRCGASNPFAGSAGPVVRLSAEALLRSELDLLLNVSGSALPAALRLPSGVPVAALDPDLVVRPGPRVIEGAERLCALLAESP